VNFQYLTSERPILARSGRWWLRSLVLDNDAGNSGRILISATWAARRAVRLDVVLTTICTWNLRREAIHAT
jgi:hypothetical protein